MVTAVSARGRVVVSLVMVQTLPHERGVVVVGPAEQHGSMWSRRTNPVSCRRTKTRLVDVPR
jgi:hypothetical protein